MKTFATVLASALALASAAPGLASDESRFDALIRKYAPRYVDQFTSFTAKTACICEPGGLKTPGVMLVDGDFINCMVPQFANGKVTAFYACSSYEVLGK